MRLLAIPSLLVLVTVTTICGQDQTTPTSQQPSAAQREAREELNRAAAAYRAGNFLEAQQHSERALSLDPTNRTAPIFVARTIHVQYKPGDDTPENVEFARAAIAAYKRILTYEPENEEAYKAIAVLYGAIHEDQLQRDWIFQHASNPLVPVKKRAEAYAVLAGKDWDCSFKITELPENKLVVMRSDKPTVVFRKPENGLEFARAKQCVESGLENAEIAIAFDPECGAAWSYKTNLLIENSKLAEMEGQYETKKAYLKAADEAQAHTSIVAEKRRRLEEAGDESESQSEGADKPESQSTPRRTQPNSQTDHRDSETSRAPIDGGELDSMAVNKPLPPYPPAARAAHVSGSVRVAVFIDESGRVVSAVAVDGHMLLQAAAVAAARQARFSPTYRDGRLVGVRGFLTYEFPSSK